MRPPASANVTGSTRGRSASSISPSRPTRAVRSISFAQAGSSSITTGASLRVDFRSERMAIGIGLPSTVPGVTGQELTEWARRADQAPLSTLATIDRIVYPNYEPLTALAAAAAVTSRIKLATCVLLAPLRSNAVLLAKQAASVHHISGGRLVFGAAVGGRADDFEVSGIDMDGRGRVFEGQLATLKRVWAGEEKGGRSARTSTSRRS